MKIMIVNSYYYPDMIGGAEHSVKILAENLYRAGHEVGVFCLNIEKKEKKCEKVNGVVVYRSTGGSFTDFHLSPNKMEKIKNYLYSFNNPTIECEFREAINSFHPDIVHTNNLPGITTVVWRICKKSNIPVVHTLRDYWLHNPWKIKKRKYVGRLFVKLTENINRKILLCRSQYITALVGPSQYIVDEFISKGYFRGVPNKRIFNCVEINYKDLTYNLKLKRERTDECVRFLYAGALTTIKGVDLLLHEFSSVKDQNIMLTICGGGPLCTLVEKFATIDKRILYYGKLSKDKLASVYLQSDVLIIPSVWAEPFGRVVIEANLYGNPVIASNVGGIPEIITKMQCGRLYDSKKKGEIAKNIKYYLDRRHIVEDIMNVESNIGEFSAEEQISEYLKIYIKCLSNV